MTSIAAYIFTIFFLGIYFLPFIFAVSRRIDQGKLLFTFITNIFLGWTIIGWFVSLGVALMSKQGEYA